MIFSLSPGESPIFSRIYETRQEIASLLVHFGEIINISDNFVGLVPDIAVKMSK